MSTIDKPRTGGPAALLLGFLAYWPNAGTSPEEIAAVAAAFKELQRKQWPEFRFVVHFGAVAIGGIASMGEESLMGGEVNLIFRLEKLASSSAGNSPLVPSEAKKRRMRTFRRSLSTRIHQANALRPIHAAPHSLSR